MTAKSGANSTISPPRKNCLCDLTWGRQPPGWRPRRRTAFRKSFASTLQRAELTILVREMREVTGFTQTELAKKAGTTQSVIARLEDAEYAGHSLTMLERIAACGVALKLRAEKKPDFDREVELV